jgi:hypothetical protein
MRRRIHVGLVGHTHTCVVMHVTYSKVKYEEEEDTCVTGDTYTGIVMHVTYSMVMHDDVSLMIHLCVT